MSLTTTKSDPIQYQIIDFLEKSIRRDIKGFTNSTIDSKCYFLFHNYRPTKNGPVGLRLTNRGYKLINRFFDNHEFETTNTLTGKILIDLDKNMKWPYYIDKFKVVFYNTEDAAWFKLAGQDLGYFTSSLI